MTPKHAKLQIFFQQIFIVLETFTVGIKTKNLPRTGVSGCFIVLSGAKSGRLIQV